MIRLQDLPAFSGLSEVCRSFGVDFTLFGGAATRAWLYLYFHPSKEFDLFDLTPFASDIDIAHSGPKEKTADIRAAIRDAVTFAPWCRWSILDSEGASRAAQNRAASTLVPIRSLTLSTATAHDLSAEIIRDFQRREVRFFRNPRYLSSELAIKGYDVELFGLLLALTTLADMIEVAGDGRLAESETSADVWLTLPAAESDLSRISANLNLQRRLWVKLANYFVRSGGSNTVYQSLVGRILESAALNHPGWNAESAFLEDTPVSISRPSAAGGFHVAELTPTVITGYHARNELDRVFRANRLDEIYGVPRPIIDPAYELVGFVPDLTLVGDSTENDQGQNNADIAFGSWADEDFLHVAWPGKDSERLDLNPAGLTACMMPWKAISDFGLSSGAAVGGTFDHGVQWVRVDVWDIIQSARNQKTKASMLILQSRLSEET